MLKKIASNTIAQLVGKFISAGLALATTTLLIRVSGVSLYGELTKLLVIIAIGFVVSDFGLNATALREFRPSSLALQFRSLLLTRLIFSLGVLFVLNLFVQLLPGGYNYASKSVFWVGSLAVVFQGIYTSCNALFQYRQNYWYSTLSAGIGTFVTAITTLYFVYYAPTLFNFLLANTLGYFLMATLSLLLANPPRISAKLPKDFIRLSLARALPIGLMLILSVIASKVDTIILGIHTISGDIGQYGLAYRFFDVILVLPVFLMNSLYPHLLNSTATTRKSLTRQTVLGMLALGLIFSFALYLSSPLLLLIRPDVVLAVTSLRILSISIPLFFVTAPLMWYFVAIGQEVQNLKIYALAATLNTALNLAFIPLYGVIASATITGVTELFILVSLLYFSHIKFEKQKII